jgi:hypothetical protein
MDENVAAAEVVEVDEAPDDAAGHGDAPAEAEGDAAAEESSAEDHAAE